MAASPETSGGDFVSNRALASFRWSYIDHCLNSFCISTAEYLILDNSQRTVFVGSYFWKLRSLVSKSNTGIWQGLATSNGRCWKTIQARGKRVFMMAPALPKKVEPSCLVISNRLHLSLLLWLLNFSIMFGEDNIQSTATTLQNDLFRTLLSYFVTQREEQCSHLREGFTV